MAECIPLESFRLPMAPEEFGVFRGRIHGVAMNKVEMWGSWASASLGNLVAQGLGLPRPKQRVARRIQVQFRCHNLELVILGCPSQL